MYTCQYVVTVLGGYGAGTKRMYTSQYVVTVLSDEFQTIEFQTILHCTLAITISDHRKWLRAGTKKNVCQYVVTVLAGYGTGTKKNVYVSTWFRCKVTSFKQSSF